MSGEQVHERISVVKTPSIRGDRLHRPPLAAGLEGVGGLADRLRIEPQA
jgi:hypothetical protein